jgi:hypothetical protein
MADPVPVLVDPNAQYDQGVTPPAIAPPSTPLDFTPVAPDAKYDTGGAIASAVQQLSADNLRDRTIGGPQYQGDYRDPLLLASSALKGAATGMGGPADMIGGGVDWLGSKLSPTPAAPDYRPPAPAPGQRITPGPFSMFGMPNSAAWLNPLRSAGAVDNPALTPQNQRERNIVATGEGGGGAIAALPLGGISPVRGLISGGAGGYAGEQLANMFPDHPILARTIGNLAVGGALGGAPRAGPTAAGEAFDRLGITSALPADTTGSRFRQWLTPKIADMPMGGGVRNRMEQTVDQWGNAVDRTAADIAGPQGVATSPQMVGQRIQDATNAELGRLNGIERTNYANVDMHMPARQPVGMTNYAQELNDVMSTMPALPNAAARTQSDFIRGLQADMIADARLGRPDWQSLSNYRTRIGAMITDPQIIGGPTQTELRRIYGALTRDMEAAVGPVGTPARTAWDTAQAGTRDLHAFVDNTASNFVGRRGATGNNLIDPETAYRNAMTDAHLGGSVLQRVRDTMPGAADQIGAYELQSRALSPPGQRANPDVSTPYSPTTFVTNTTGAGRGARLSQGAQDALWPGVTDQINDLRTTGYALRATEKATNRSGTGGYLGARETLEALGNAALYGGGGYAALGWPGAVAGAIGAVAKPLLPGLLGSAAMQRAPRSYSGGVLQIPLRTYGGTAENH